MSIKKRAYGKVNLALDVLGRRENGYHDVKMVMQNLDIYDELEFELEDMTENICCGNAGKCGENVVADDRAAGSGAMVVGEGAPEPYSIVIETDNPDIPTDERNLIYKAAKLLFEEYDIRKRLTVKLVKNIPVEAGMAGGSTDAAATLHAVNELAGLGLSTQQLMDYGVKLGADVPFCVMGKTALSEGIGEILTSIPALPDCVVAVAKPSVGVSTKLVYTELDGIMSEASITHPDVDGMVAVLREQETGHDTYGGKEDIVHRVASLMGNVLESVTIPMHPEIARIKKIMLENGAVNAMMSGSGPTVYGIYESSEQAEAALNEIKTAGLAAQTFVTKPV